MGHITTIVRVSECDFEYTFEQDILQKCVWGHETTLCLYIYIYMQPCCSWMFEQWLLLIPFVVGRMTGPWLHPK